MQSTKDLLSANDLFGLPNPSDDPFLYTNMIFPLHLATHDEFTQSSFAISSLALKERKSGLAPPPSTFVNSNAIGRLRSPTRLGVNHSLPCNMSLTDEKPSTRTIPLKDAIACSVANANGEAFPQFVDLPGCLPPSPRYTPEEDFIGSPSLESLLDEADFWTPVVIPTYQEPCSDGMMSDYLEISEFEAEPAVSETAESAPVLTDADVVQNQRRKLNNGFLRNCGNLAHPIDSGDVSGDVSGAGDQTAFTGFLGEDMFTGLEELIPGNIEVRCGVNTTAQHEFDHDGELYLRLWSAFPELIGHLEQTVVDVQDFTILLESKCQRAIQEATTIITADVSSRMDFSSNFLQEPPSPSSTSLSGHPTPELDYSDFTDEENVSTPVTTYFDEPTDFKAPANIPIESLEEPIKRGRKRSLSHETEGTQKRRKCNECGEPISNIKNLALHRKMHVKEMGANKCSYVDPITNVPCNKFFARSYDLNRHQVKHCPEGGRSYDCNICKKSFSRLDALQRHHRTQGHSKHATLDRSLKALSLSN